MREARREHYILLRGVDALRVIESQTDHVKIGALATHEEIAGLAHDNGPLGALAEAARRSAFPAVRNVATLGGNLAAPFPQADLLPPLLAADATVELAGETIAIDEWVRGERPARPLIVAVTVPAPPRRRSWFERLTVRGGAEYSIVSVAVSADLATDGTIEAARVAVGAVQDTPTRVPAAEQALVETQSGKAAGAAAAAALTAREGLDAPGWYRLEVLPALVARAVAHVGAS
jgi:carbon-monoxide dehydrogenase medium subunit